MPADSIEQAVAWYRRRVDQMRSGAQRRSREAAAASVQPHRPDARGNELAQVRALIERLVPAAEAEFARRAAGQDVALLRAALAQVPVELRHEIVLPRDLAYALSADVFAQIVGLEPARPAGVASPEITDEDAEWLAAFWFAVWAGEIRAAPTGGAA